MENQKMSFWSREETNIARQALKDAKGKQKEAAQAVSSLLPGRSESSIANKMSALSRKHPSLRKKYFKKLRERTIEVDDEMETVERDNVLRMHPTMSENIPLTRAAKFPRIEVHEDHIRIYL